MTSSRSPVSVLSNRSSSNNSESCSKLSGTLPPILFSYRDTLDKDDKRDIELLSKYKLFPEKKKLNVKFII